MYNFLSQLLNPFLVFSNLITIVFLIFFLLHLIFKKKILKYINNIIIFILLIFCFIPIGYYSLYYLEKDFINQKKIESIDNIIILSGSEKPSLTFLTQKINLNDGSERLIEAVRLTKNNKNANILFLGGASEYNNDFNESNVAKQFFENINFDMKKVRFFPNSSNTIENLKDLIKIIDNNENNVVITSAFHMKRTKIISEELGINIVPFAVDHRSILINDSSMFNIYNDFDIGKNISMFNIFFREMMGILAVKIFL